MGAKILITGIDGFTGTHLSSYLVKLGYDVYGTSFSKTENKKYRCDITNKENILAVLEKVNPDYLIHLSGISFTAHGETQDFYTINTIGTINILDAFVELNLTPKKIILASSATVYGNQGVEILDESLCPKPSNHYGASKYAMECLARNYFGKLPIIITRPFNYTGIGQAEHFLIPKIVKHYRDKKEVIELGNVDISREFNDVEYVCKIYEKLLLCKYTSEIVNICSGKGIKLFDVIETMNKLSGYQIKVNINPAFIRKDEINSLTGLTTKLMDMIGFVCPQEFKKTLEEIYND